MNGEAFQCSVKGCAVGDNAAHARRYDYIEETVGRRAAEDFEAEHLDDSWTADGRDARFACGHTVDGTCDYCGGGSEPRERSDEDDEREAEERAIAAGRFGVRSLRDTMAMDR